MSRIFVFCFLFFFFTFNEVESDTYFLLGAFLRSVFYKSLFFPHKACFLIRLFAAHITFSGFD